MSLPLFRDKFRSADFLLSPQSFWQRTGSARFPPNILLCHQTAVADRLVRPWSRSISGPFAGQIRMRPASRGQVGIASHIGIGGPALAGWMELCIAAGLKKLVMLGVGGGIAPGLHPGDVILVDSAFRDEGTSYHYLPTTKTVAGSPKMTENLETALSTAAISFQKGATWSTDAPFRETWAEVDWYSDAGALTVEMEIAACFAVAEAYQIDAAAIVVISDHRHHKQWRLPSNQTDIQAHLWRVSQLVLSTCLKA